jgi:hypothetical protein
MDVDINIRDKNGQTITRFSTDDIEFPLCDKELIHGKLYGEILNSKKLHGMLNDGTLTIELRMRLAVDNYDDVQPQKSFIDQLVLKLFDGENADVAFEVEGKFFFAHKWILKLRAPKFVANFCEASSKANPVSIQDVDQNTFDLMLKHAYGKDIPDHMWEPRTILEAASKYGFNVLKDEAEARYMCGLSFVRRGENHAIDALLYASCQNLPLLKKSAIHFIAKNFKKAMELESFAKLYESPDLMKEVMAAALDSASRKRDRDE